MTVTRVWLTATEAAEYTRRHVNSVRLAALSGELSGCRQNPAKPRSPWTFTTADLDRWVERGRARMGRSA